ncbi:prepilin-type N-terminal cleavage/methylation domain-containing protein [Cytobacillus oceanisediminis]|uniref:prepilin-type N-terminal cleavage/methylation domain-containing protein n=1 Tax=Cytobacillus oceanisediminis TaxID=665099 RepID=UPI001D13B1DA|nr:prepilin-type N-terminal cleavage/methylation domain-containing protein [Cytobacillus oceanisediminis]
MGLDALGFILLVGFFLLYIYVLGGDYFCLWDVIISTIVSNYGSSSSFFNRLNVNVWPCSKEVREVNWKDIKGLTLVEVIVAIAIIGIIAGIALPSIVCIIEKLRVRMMEMSVLVMELLVMWMRELNAACILRI